MSIKALIDLRTKHRMMPNAVWVLLGDVPTWLEDGPDTVIIRPGHQDFDFRALIGTHVDIFEIGDHWELFDKVCTAVEAAKPRSKGMACRSGVAGLNAVHERVLSEALRLMTCS